MLFVHIAAGVVSLAAGAVAMSALKGGALHRRAGTIFVYAMLVMSALGTVLAVLKPTLISVLAGALTFYLVSTSLLTVRRNVLRPRAWLAGLMMLGFLVGALGVSFALAAAGHPGGRLEGIPSAGYLPFAFVAFAGALLDARLLRSGTLSGVARITRHLWRMGFAMSIATLSFFLGQAKLFPAEVRGSGLLAVPVVLVMGFFLYWLVRVRRRRLRPALP
jgi:uncharacterized membrane protein